MIVCDQGTFEPFEKAKTKKDQEHDLTKAFYEGAMHIVLHGEKLKGQFALIKKQGAEDNAWFLMKIKGSHVEGSNML